MTEEQASVVEAVIESMQVIAAIIELQTTNLDFGGCKYKKLPIDQAEGLSLELRKKAAELERQFWPEKGG